MQKEVHEGGAGDEEDAIDSALYELSNEGKGNRMSQNCPVGKNKSDWDP